MTNEALVERIRNGYSVTDNLQLLYVNNLPLIKRYIKPFTFYELEEDCLQEAFFGLWEAVKHYETSENVLFMTYAGYWIKQSVQRYIEKCGAVVKIPSHTRQKIARYKKNVERLSQKQGRTPTDAEVAANMGVSVAAVQEIKGYMQGVASLDSPLSIDDELTLGDSVQADFSLEDETIDKMYDEYSKSELWGIVEHYTGERENHIIKEYFIHNKSMPEIAKEQSITVGRVREIKEAGLRRLRIGKAKRELLEKFDIVEAGEYRNSMCKFNEHGFTSTVEYIAIRRAELKAEYEERVKQILALDTVESRKI